MRLATHVRDWLDERFGWDELTPALKSDHFHVADVPSRLASLKKDPWADFFKVRQAVSARAKKKVGWK